MQVGSDLHQRRVTRIEGPYPLLCAPLLIGRERRMMTGNRLLELQNRVVPLQPLLVGGWLYTRH